MIFQISTQWMKKGQFGYKYTYSRDEFEQYKRRNLQVGIGHLDVIFTIINRIGKFRKEHGI